MIIAITIAVVRTGSGYRVRNSGKLLVPALAHAW